jgi:hypothetical protein
MNKPPWVTNDTLWLQQCAEVVISATKVLEASGSLTENARVLSTLGYQLRASRGPAFTVFRNLASETEHFPVGKFRSSWSSKALPSVDAERVKTETRFGLHAVDAATSLIAAYGANAK